MAKKKEFKCPECGNTPGDEERESIEYVDWTPSHRPVLSAEGKKVEVDWDAYKDYPEAAKDPEFYCHECDHSFSADDWDV